MNDTAPPDIDTLRQFVRDELDDETEKEIYRWMIRCSDSRLPVLLESLEIEWEQVQADAELSEAGQTIGELFIDLWQAGRARVDTDAEVTAESQVSYAFAESGDPSRAGIGLRPLDDNRPDSREVGIRMFARPGTRRVHGILVTDREQPRVFIDQSPEPATETRRIGDEQRYIFDRDDGRATFWYVGSTETNLLGSSLEAIDECADFLQRAVSDDSKTVRAARLTERYLSDLYE
jgi:hypothetical protein